MPRSRRRRDRWRIPAHEQPDGEVGRASTNSRNASQASVMRWWPVNRPESMITMRFTRSGCSTATRSPIGPPQSWTTSGDVAQVELLEQAGGERSGARSCTSRCRPACPSARSRRGRARRSETRRRARAGSRGATETTRWARRGRTRRGRPRPRPDAQAAGRRVRESARRTGSPAGPRAAPRGSAARPSSGERRQRRERRFQTRAQGLEFGGSDRCSPRCAASSSTSNPGPIVAISNSTPLGSRK